MATELPAPVPSGPSPDAVALPKHVLDPSAAAPGSPTSPKVIWQAVASFVVTVALGAVGALTPETFVALGPVLAPLLYAVVVALAGYATGWLVRDPIRDVGTKAIAEDASATLAAFLGRHNKH